MFDTALLESDHGLRVRSQGTGLPYAIAAHLVLIGAFVGASVWAVGDPAEPETRFPVFPTFLSAPAPAPGGGNPHPPPSRPPVRNNVLVPPTSLRELPDTPRQDPLPSGPEGPEQDGTAPGLGPGTGPGIPGGTGVVPGALPGESGDSEAILRPGGDVKAPLLITRVEPLYPELARRTHMEGTVILEAVITAAGDVRDAYVLKSANPVLDAAALQAVRQWRYRPATWDGRAVPVYLTVTVRFSLKD